METRKKSLEIGTLIGSVIILSHTRELRPSKKAYKFLCNCQCSCGEFFTVETGNLKRMGNNAKCGKCRNREKYKTIDGNSTKKENNHLEYKSYYTWKALKDRCYNKNNSRYYNYGAKGIKVCDSWLESYDNFLKDMGLPLSANDSIDRINTNGNYEKDNCRWTDSITQANNKTNNRIITYNNESLTLQQWANKVGIKRETIAKRLNSGCSEEVALGFKEMQKTIYTTPNGTFNSLKEAGEAHGLKTTATHSRFNSDKFPTWIKTML